MAEVKADLKYERLQGCDMACMPFKDHWLGQMRAVVNVRVIPGWA